MWMTEKSKPAFGSRMRRTHRVIAVAMGASLILALTPPSWGATPGPGYSWGDGDSGRLGIGSAAGNQLVPTAMAAPAGMAAPLQFTAIAAGRNHGCALVEDNRAYPD
jgi:hypothetical protein